MNRIAVFCGSAAGVREAYSGLAVALGKALLARNLELVYGGAGIGLMGAIADTVLDGGGRVTGIIPDFFSRKEIAHTGLLDLIYVPSMHERKRRMAEMSDGFIALPGGYGTLDELFEITTWAQLDLHRKPVGILNAEGYFDELFRFMDHMSAEGFVRPAHQQMILRDNDPENLLSRMAAYEAPEQSKWIDLIKA
jgi:uncharacterized protein (TIGR00730 family)